MIMSKVKWLGEITNRISKWFKTKPKKTISMMQSMRLKVS